MLDVVDQTTVGAELRSLFSYRNLGRAAAWAVVIWLLMTILVACVQRRLVFVGYNFHRKSPLKAKSVWRDHRLHDVTVAASDGTPLRGWIATAEPVETEELTPSDVGGRPMIVYFGGNAGTRAYRTDSLQLLTDLGCNVLICDYRGFADNDGVPSERILLSDALDVHKHATDVLGVPAEQIVIYGESLGGAVAAATAATLCEKDVVPAGLVLRATFASMTETAGHHYPWLPVNLLLRYRFETDSRIPKVTCPLLQFHGRHDSVVPISHGRRLFGLAPEKSASGTEKEFIELKSGHNDIVWRQYSRLSRETARWMREIQLLPPEDDPAD